MFPKAKRLDLGKKDENKGEKTKKEQKRQSKPKKTFSVHSTKVINLNNLHYKRPNRRHGKTGRKIRPKSQRGENPCAIKPCVN